MTVSSRLAAHRGSAPHADDACDRDEILNPDEPGEDAGNPPETKSKKKDKTMDEDTKAAIDAARTEGRELGFKSANERMNSVFASEHYAGREASAAKLLSKPGLSAEDIIGLLADLPKDGGATADLSGDAAKAAAEAAGREEMRAALAETQNSNVDPNGGGADKPAAAATAWDNVIARMNKTRAA